MIINCDKTDCRVCNFHHCGLHDYNKAVKEYSRPKGEWIDNSEYGYVECPFCHEATNCDNNIEALHYCWNCGAELGADMRNEE